LNLHNKRRAAPFPILSIVLLAGWIAGCNKAAPPPPGKPAGPTAAASTPAADESAVTLQRIDKAGFEAVVGHLPGKVILVDFWATWCIYCRENFPHVVELSHKFGPQGLVVISVACDDEKETSEILKFLREQKATFQNLRAALGSSPQSFEDFDIDGGALPHYKLYDRQGKLRKTFSVDPDADEQFKLDEIDAAVEELLNESSPAR
jgi:thiol-disulfide isomerase/thioredoxin